MFIKIKDVRINVEHIRSYVQRRDGVLFSFDTSELMVAHAAVDEVDKAIDIESLAIMAAAARRAV